MPDWSNVTWVVVALMVVALGVVMAYAAMRNARRGRALDRQSQAGTKGLYDQLDGRQGR